MRLIIRNVLIAMLIFFIGLIAVEVRAVYRNDQIYYEGPSIIEPGVKDALDLSPFYARGKIEAIQDLQRGRMGFRQTGFVVEHTTFKRMLLKSYGIRFDWVSCITTDEIEAKVAGYNEIMQPVIESRYGKDLKNIFDGVWKRATQEDERMYRKRKGFFNP